MWKRTGDRRTDGGIAIPFLIVMCALIFIFCSLSKAYGGWGTGGCPPVGGPVYVPQQVQYVSQSWSYPADWKETGRAFLYRGTVLDGVYNYYTGLYTPADGSAPYHPEDYPVWRAKDGCKCQKCKGDCKCGNGSCCGDKDCKCCCPAGSPAFEVTENHGLVLDKIPTTGDPRYFLHDGNGSREITRDETKQILAKGLDDDSKKPYLVVVCELADLRGQVLNDLYSNPALTWLREHTRLQAYTGKNHHHLDGYKLDQDQRFQQSGLMLALVEPHNGQGLGKRLYVQYDYEGGPERLNREARRRIDPNFDPNKDGTPKPQPTPNTPSVPETNLIALIGQIFAALPGWTYILASLGAALLIVRGGK